MLGRRRAHARPRHRRRHPIFSVVNGVLLEPLPYENGSRLVLINQAATLGGQQDVGVSIKELYDYRAQLASFDSLVELHQMNFDLLRRGDPDRVATGVVSPNFLAARRCSSANVIPRLTSGWRPSTVTSQMSPSASAPMIVRGCRSVSNPCGRLRPSSRTSRPAPPITCWDAAHARADVRTAWRTPARS